MRPSAANRGVSPRLALFWGAMALAGWVSAGAAGLEWRNGEGLRFAPLSVPAGGRPGFTLLSNEALGIRFTNILTLAQAVENNNYLNGSGCAAGDVDGDGLPDLYFCTVGGGGNRLYRNLGGFRFEDITGRAGVACTNMHCTGAVFADLNGDGRPDLLATSCGGPNACFLNEGGGRFRDVTVESGLVQKAGSTSMALADIDGNGTLDLYVANYGETTILRTGGAVTVRMVAGKPVVTGRFAKRIRIENGIMVEYGEPHQLYLNDGAGHFKPVSWTDGTFLDEEGQPLKESPWDMGLSVMFRDINGDGFPDLYVCNDFQTPDRIWINDGRGRFRALPRLALRDTSHFSMCVDFADLNRDGFDDLFVGDMLSRRHSLEMTQMIDTNPPPRVIGQIDLRLQIRRNVLQLNRGDGTYADIAWHSGAAASEWNWTLAFMDVDLDGYEDLLIGNGHAYDTQDLDTVERIRGLGPQTFRESQNNLMAYPALPTPNLLFRNRGNLTFEETGAAWGFDSTQVTHGLIQVDLDGDGGLDVVLNCLNAPPLIYRNNSSAPRVAVQLKGLAPNTAGIGARIRVLGGAVPLQSQEILCGGRYLSGEPPMRVFAAGTNGGPLTLEVAWRSGRVSVVSNALANALYEIDERGARPARPAAAPAPEPPLFADASASLGHAHHEEEFDFAARQPLLVRNLSQLGPGVAWVDLDGDGRDELVIGAGRGGQPAVYRAGGPGGFALIEGAGGAPLPDDLTGLAGWVPAPGRRALLAGLANYESGGAGSALLSIELEKGRVVARTEALGGGFAASMGPVAVADYDGDGALDVFAAGRVIPGRYPEAAPSRLYRNDHGRLVPDGANNPALERAGLVSGALWSDLDGDGFPELILACEWGPLRVFANHAGRLVEQTQALGLESWTGWWAGVTTGDLDGDGRMEIIASNAGLNTPYSASPERPERLYYGDFAGQGRVDLVEAAYDTTLAKGVPRCGLAMMSAALPWVRGKYPTHQAYSTAGVEEILGDVLPSARQASAVTLASVVFFNRGGRFEPVLLPPEAQWAPAFGLNVADFDGDGAEDLFIAQNLFALRRDVTRWDAGRGLVLLGDGRGRLAPMAGRRSGVRVYGEQRGSAVGDFDGDGRPDLAVAQNGAATMLYRNQGAKPGLRVRLQGPPGNPCGYGATVRLQYAGRLGPAREVHAGSGYWSQDSAVQILGMSGAPAGVWVRWPGGKTTTTPLQPGQAEAVAVF